MKIGILFGGNSLEHEISIISAFQLKKKLESEYDLCMIYIDNESNIYDASKTTLDDFKYNKKNKMKKSSFVLGGIKNTELDCMVLCMHGENGEDGIAAALMRFYKIKYVGSDLFASSICMDKYLTYMYLANCGIKMIDSYIYTYNDYLSGDSVLEYPSIVKPLTGGSSIGIYVINNKKEERDVLLKAFKVSKELLVQKYYDNIVEYNLAIDSVGESHLERIVKKDNIFSFNNKYNESFKQMHQAIDDDILYDDFKQIGRNVYTLIKAKGIIRIDFFLIDGVIYVNEINTIPGALAMYLYDDFNSIIRKEIELELLRSDIVYPKGNFLITSNICK